MVLLYLLIAISSYTLVASQAILVMLRYEKKTQDLLGGGGGLFVCIPYLQCTSCKFRS